MDDTISRSPGRGRFPIEMLNKRLLEGEVDQQHVEEMTEFYEKMIDQEYVKEISPEFRKNNLEFDLRTTEWILEKVRADEVYSQNLYAAMCNNEFLKTNIEDTPENIAKLLKDGLEKWSCSWRHAGGIIADMRQEGDYVDWYCSGIRDSYETENDGFLQRRYVSESTVTEEIEQDLKRLGWRAVPYEDE